LPVPAKVVSNICFGGPNHDEIFCTTGDPPGVFHAKVGVKGFAGHPGKPMKVTRELHIIPLKPHPDADKLRAVMLTAAAAKVENGQWTVDSKLIVEVLIEGLTDKKLRADTIALMPEIERAAIRHAKDKPLLAEIKRLGGTATIEVDAPLWLREIAGDDSLQV